MGMYISSDPIGLAGGFNTYAYVKDTNTWVDVLGLSGELVYQLIRDNKVVYYGITSRTALERMAEHGKTKVFDNMEILADGLTHDQARSIEGALIRQRLKERADDWSDFDSIKARLDKSGLDNRNRGRIKERWTSENPLDDLRDKIYKKQIEENAEWLKTANKPTQALLAHIEILIMLAKRFPIDANLSIKKDKVKEWKNTFNDWFERVGNKIPAKYRDGIKANGDELFKQLEQYGH